MAAVEDLLTPENARIARAFDAARKAGLATRLKGLMRVGPYRQTKAGNVGFWGLHFLAGSEHKPALLLVGGDGHPSGVPHHIWHLCAVLTNQAQITVASDVSHGGYDGLEDVGVRHITVPGLKSSLNPARLWRGWRGLLRLMRAEPADVVWLHARLPVVFGRLAMALRLWRPKGTRVVITYHGLPFGAGHRPGFATLSKAVEWLLLRTCPPLDLVFLTQAQADRMAGVLGRSEQARHRVHVLPNSSNLGPLPPAPSRPGRHLVMTGRCGWQKNYPLALRLFAHLPEDFTLTLCGAGTDTDTFQAEAEGILSNNALSRVRFAGPLRDVRPVLAAADGYMLCSRYEGLPIGALEAFEAGLPLILSQFDGAEDLAATHPLAKVLGFNDLAEDATRITDVINRYTDDHEALTGEIKTAWAAHWSREAFAERVKALYAELSGRP